MKKEQLQKLAETIIFNLDESSYDHMVNDFYNSDFILVSADGMDAEKDHKLKKFIKKIGLLKKEDDLDKFYQLFYYLNLTFNVTRQNGMIDKEHIRIILLNNEISKFIDVLKTFVMNNVEFTKPDAKDLIMDYKFINKIFIEDYKIFGYKYNLCRVLKKMNYVEYLKYKSFKFIKNEYEVSFDILKNDDYYALPEQSIQNSKLKVISNFLYMLQDLEVLDGFN